MTSKRFERYELRVFRLKESADSEAYNEYLGYCNISPEEVAELAAEVADLAKRRSDIDAMRKASTMATQREGEVKRGLRDIANPIVNLARSNFQDSELGAKLDLSTRYATRVRIAEPNAGEAEAGAEVITERRAAPRPRSRDADMARFRSMGRTLAGLSDEEKAVFAKGGIDEAFIDRFQQALAELESLYASRPQLSEKIAAASQAWSADFEASEKAWKKWCSNMRSQLFSRRIPHMNAVLEALGMEA